MWTGSWTSHPNPVSERVRADAGLADTSVAVDFSRLDRDSLPAELSISALTLAELAVGPLAVDDPEERARRQLNLQQAEAMFEPLPFDAAAAHAYVRVYAAVLASGRKARGARAVDLLIAATAVSARLPLFTRNPADFEGLEGVLEVVAV